jgi:Sec-independent protein translocase protein TatA
MGNGFHFGIGIPELVLILVAALLSAGWRRLRR